MKKGWEYKKLGEVCNRITDGSHNPPKGVVKSENIMLSSQNVQNDHLDMSNIRYISDVDYRLENQRTQASKGDVLLTIVGTIGRACVLKGTEGNLTFQRSVAVLKPSKEIISRFLMYFLFSQNSSLNATAHGAAQKGIYLKQLGNIGIFYPPLSEQQSIVDYLDSAFAKIDAMKANAEKALNEAKALFQASLKEMLEPKEGWEEKKLGDVIEHLRTGLNPRTHFKLNTPDAEGFYITVRELKGFTIEPDEKTDKVNRAAIKRINERSNLKIGDVLFSGTGTIGKTALVSELPEKWNIKEGVYAMTPKHSELDSKYFIYYIGSEFFLRLVNDKAAGTGVRSIPMKELVKLPISIPPLTEQHSIATTLDSLKSKVDRLQANYEKFSQECDALKQAILRQVFE